MVPRLRTFLGNLLRPAYLRRTVRPGIFHPLPKWYKADLDARRAARIWASHLCRVDAEEYARVDFSSFDACMGYYARLGEPAPQFVHRYKLVRFWSRFDVLARASPEWQDEAHAIMRKAAEKIHVIVLLSQEPKEIDPMVAVDFLKLAHFMEVINADFTLFKLAGLLPQDPAPRRADDSGKERGSGEERDSEKPGSPEVLRPTWKTIREYIEIAYPTFSISEILRTDVDDATALNSKRDARAVVASLLILSFFTNI
ncbi:hypothetical protein DFH08DRAFT_1083071 [Mycena albidolilacea]|uniref:Uncharacterized protein n=1 Tax=Mycena albidolilacea TaxID=1033008 RepID=A0AAD7EMP5_9AGAR|nr:hypothetical protein DFH08DRAFT_1083071 [Mycena albidolilacea]